TPAWTCPSCGRRVPRHVDACRCGLKQAHPQHGNDETPSKGRRSRGGVLMRVGGLMIGGGLAVMFMRSGEPSAQHTVDLSASQSSSSKRAGATQTSEPAPPEQTTAGASLLTTPPPAPEETTPPPPSSLEDVVGRVLPAVASITAGQARGTGFFVRNDQVL